MAVATVAACFGAPALDCPFQDGIVFSAAHPVRLTGRAAASSTVTVEACGRKASAEADAAGRFAVEMPPLGVVREPFEVRVTDRDGTCRLADCLSGLVLMAAGQSNMEVPVREALDPEREIAAANFPHIREFKVGHDFAFEPQTTCEGRWTAVTPKTAADVGAIGYFTARRLHRELGGIPVGIVNNSYSATSIQPWLPLELLRGMKGAHGALRSYERFAPLGHDGVIRRREELGKSFLISDTKNEGEAKGWHRGAQADWKDIAIPGWLDYQVWGEFSDGAFWIARTFTVPEGFPTDGLEFRATAIDDYDVTYINGVRVGATGEETPDSYDQPRAYRIPAGLVKPGENVISIRIFDTAHAGGIPPGAKVCLAHGERELPLGGTWKTQAERIVPAKAWPAEYLPLMKIYHAASVLYNAMFCPVRGLPADAILWYQGESNAGEADYGAMLNALIGRWRTDLGEPDVPFVCVQLAAFKERPKAADDVGDWPLARRQQAEARALPNVRLVPTIDIGDANRIHPLNKQEVGRRTALVLLQDFFAKDRFRGAVAYPEATAVRRTGDALVVTLKDVAGLRTVDGRAPQSFAVVGAADAKTRKTPAAWAQAKVVGETLVVTVPPELPNPVRLRYAWHMNPDVNTVNGLGFPLLPFDMEIGE